MRTVWYWAVIEQHHGEYWVTLPDLPGPNAADKDLDEALRLVTQFAAEHVADLVERGAEVPKARNAEEIEHDPDIREWGRALVPVDVPGRSTKINLSMDEGLLARLDRAAADAGESRSGYVATAVHQRLRAERSDRPTALREQGASFIAFEQSVFSALRHSDVARSASVHGEPSMGFLPFVLPGAAKDATMAGRIGKKRRARKRRVLEKKPKGGRHP